MAIDTAAKRFSIMDFDLPFAPGQDPPNSAVAAADRSTLLWLYNGIALAGAPTFQACWAMDVNSFISGMK